MIDEIKKYGQAVVVVDIADRHQIMGIELSLIAKIVDELKCTLKDAGTVESDQEEAVFPCCL